MSGRCQTFRALTSEQLFLKDGHYPEFGMATPAKKAFEKFRAVGGGTASTLG